MDFMELAYESVGWICVGQDGVRRKYFVPQRGTELQSMRYGEYFDQLMVFNVFEQGFVSWIHLEPISEFLRFLLSCVNVCFVYIPLFYIYIYIYCSSVNTTIIYM
jgi:hypothetical protein